MLSIGHKCSPTVFTAIALGASAVGAVLFGVDVGTRHECILIVKARLSSGTKGRAFVYLIFSRSRSLTDRGNLGMSLSNPYFLAFSIRTFFAKN